MDKKILVIGNDVQTEALLSQIFAGSDFQVLIISGNGSSVSPSGLLGPDLIISPSHEALLPNVQPENVKAMAEAALEQ